MLLIFKISSFADTEQFPYVIPSGEEFGQTKYCLTDLAESRIHRKLEVLPVSIDGAPICHMMLVVIARIRLSCVK